MKVLLLQDIKGVGRRDEIKEVSSGYALNSLIPQKKVVPATVATVAAQEKKHADAVAKEQATKEALLRKLKSVGGASVTLKRTANEKGHLFAALHKGEVIKAFEDVLGTSIPVTSITIPDLIKEVGEYNITIQPFDKGILAKLHIVKE